MSPSCPPGSCGEFNPRPFGVSERQIKLDYPVLGAGPSVRQEDGGSWAAAVEVQTTQTGWWSPSGFWHLLRRQIAPPPGLWPLLILTAHRLITTGQMFNILALITHYILSQYAPKWLLRPNKSHSSLEVISSNCFSFLLPPSSALLSPASALTLTHSDQVPFVLRFAMQTRVRGNLKRYICKARINYGNKCTT